MLSIVESSRGAGAQTGDYKRDSLWVRFLFEKMKYFLLSLVTSKRSYSVKKLWSLIFIHFQNIVIESWNSTPRIVLLPELGTDNNSALCYDGLNNFFFKKFIVTCSKL